MLRVPEKIESGFTGLLGQTQVQVIHYNYYKKWLRYYLDYCHKYRFDPLDPAGLPNFITKLKEKKQTGFQQKQAHESIRLFYALIRQHPDLKRVLPSMWRCESENNDKALKVSPSIPLAVEPGKPNLVNHNRTLEINKGQTNYS